MMSTRAMTRQQAWDQIPWLINGTLDEDEAKAVEAFIATCPECRAELDRQQRVNQAIQDFDAPMPDQAAALESIAHRLTPQKTSIGVSGWIREAFDRLGTPFGAALGGVAALGALFLVFGLSITEPRFETLTSPDPAADGIEIRLRLEANASASDIKGLMADAGAENITGPSDTGLIRGVVSQEFADKIVNQLKADPRVVFITRDN